MTENLSWKRYLTAEAARPQTFDELGAERAHELDRVARRARVLARIAELSAEIATATEHQDPVLAGRLKAMRRSARADLQRLDAEG